MVDTQFYPTPPELADRMCEKIDFSKVKTILEPSVGNGDLIKAIQRNNGKWFNGKFHKNPFNFMIDVCEVDERMAEQARGKWYLVENDFLRYSTFTRYDLVIMNPPFRNGEKHLLHAIDLLKNGGQCVCILNAETIRNPFSLERKRLVAQLEELNADIEFLSDTFKNAERKTDVDIALIYFRILSVSERDILSDLAEAADMPLSGGKVYDMVSSDPIEALVQRFKFEASTGLRMIDEVHVMEKYFSDPEAEKNPALKGLNGCILGVSCISNETGDMPVETRFLRRLRERYWRTLFAMPELLNLMTDDVRQRYNAEIERFKAIDFTMSNIKKLQVNLSKSAMRSIEEAVVKEFDKLTYRHSMEKDGNVHLYDGWKSNSAFKINKKVVIPCYGLFFYGLETYKLVNALADIEKILNYLDGGNTIGDSLQAVIDKRFKDDWGAKVKKPPYQPRERLSFKYFDVICYQKGTIHLYFKDEKLLKRWNLFVGRKKNWLPPDYGKKDYSRMTVEEQAVVNSFEGKKQYNETVLNAGYYLNGVSVGMLGSGT